MPYLELIGRRPPRPVEYRPYHDRRDVYQFTRVKQTKIPRPVEYSVKDRIDRSKPIFYVPRWERVVEVGPWSRLPVMRLD